MLEGNSLNEICNTGNLYFMSTDHLKNGINAKILIFPTKYHFFYAFLRVCVTTFSLTDDIYDVFLTQNASSRSLFHQMENSWPHLLQEIVFMERMTSMPKYGQISLFLRICIRLQLQFWFTDTSSFLTPNASLSLSIKWKVVDLTCFKKLCSSTCCWEKLWKSHLV